MINALFGITLGVNAEIMAKLTQGEIRRLSAIEDRKRIIEAEWSTLEDEKLLIVRQAKNRLKD
jgi:hypothetical protein